MATFFKIYLQIRDLCARYTELSHRVIILSDREGRGGWLLQLSNLLLVEQQNGQFITLHYKWWCRKDSADTFVESRQPSAESILIFQMANRIRRIFQYLAGTSCKTGTEASSCAEPESSQTVVCSHSSTSRCCAVPSTRLE